MKDTKLCYVEKKGINGNKHFEYFWSEDMGAKINILVDEIKDLKLEVQRLKNGKNT